MAIFSRRDLQAALNSLFSKLSQEHLNGLVKRLNEAGAVSLAAEWEVVLIAAFAKCGRVQHEVSFGGRSRPDLYFQFGESGSLEFVADIRTISDVNTHSENPYQEFTLAIRQLLIKYGHTSAGINVQVEHREEGDYGDSKMKLQLPEKQDIAAFVKRELGVFLANIAREPDKDANLHYNQKGIHFSVRYNSKEKWASGGGHVSYTVPYSKTRNPLHRALNRKRNQLANSGYDGLKAIILCDGGCDAFKEKSSASAAYGCREIVEAFLRAHQSILFVLVLQIEQQFSLHMSTSSIQIRPKLYWNPIREKTLSTAMCAAVNRVLPCLPAPEATPANALNWLNGRNKNVGRHLEKFSMQGKTIKISARTLTELLAGKLDQKQFLEQYGFKPTERNPQPMPFFDWQLRQGHTLRNAFVERDQHKDDDLIVLEYDGPDPAISPFHVPKCD
jgi:hypothetical protein